MEWTPFKVEDPTILKKQFLCWAAKFPVCVLLDSNENQQAPESEYEWILGVDTLDEFIYSPSQNPFVCFQEFVNNNKSWLLGWIHYDIKNHIEELESNHSSTMDESPFYFFVPRYVITCKDKTIRINRNFPESSHLLGEVSSLEIPTPESASEYKVLSSIAQEDYVEKVIQIQDKIKDGVIYELNLCREISGHVLLTDLHLHYLQLSEQVKSPLSCYFKKRDYHVLCFSPERFLKRKGDSLTSQPIKGTRKVALIDEENNELIRELEESVKERAEHVMIVDLVRNDLSKSCEPGSVLVAEFCKIYSFPYVHQMISSIYGKLSPDKSVTEIIQNAFPMGSMTGAPKIQVMKEIEETEINKRGLFSGCIGYIDPEQNFDLNVVIRTLEYKETTRVFSVQSGGAITIDSDPQQEWEELMLKSNFILNYLNANS